MGIKYYYSLFTVCFAVLFISCGASSAEEETLDASYEETRLRSLFDDESTLEATHVDHGIGESGTFKSSRPLKRFIVPISTTDLGLDIPIGRPYFMQPQLQKQSQPQNQHQYQPQHQQQNQQHHQQQQQQQQQQQYHHQQQSQGPAAEHFGFGPTSPGGSVNGGGGGGGGYVEQSESFYQTGGGGVGGVSGGSGSGGENVNFDKNEFTDFVPSTGFRSPVSPSVPSSSAPFSSSPQHHPPSFSALPQQLHSSPSPLFDEGSSGQMSFDPTGFDHDSPSAGLGYPSINGGGYDFHHQQQQQQQQQQAPVIHKSIYVHVAPPDDEPPRKQRVIMPNVPPKKNYQIVFIKAPTPPSPIAPIIPPPPQHSDKTLIYVLHPKPEEMPPIHVPAPPVTQPLKPEVYFIKYKNREESHSAGAGDYGSGQSGVLPSPGEEFGGGGSSSVDSSGGYLHRRYGRENQSPSALSVTTKSSPSSSSQPSPTSSAEEVVDDGGGDDVTTSAGQREATSEAAAAVDYSTSGETEVGELLRGGYSTEYNDASVDSTNLSETHVVPFTDAPKGKNGH
ncbi:putative uncharacterized protein DDB_G0291608 [Sipha flava]|uniref:DUF243 domain-containing protein n=3 Tax=Sipha flava TaxID=143950 RepID=A0A8B8G434_9HEMI|nr:putative uncharacterized protein DDB_G0291608 [Sipha flava]